MLKYKTKYLKYKLKYFKLIQNGGAELEDFVNNLIDENEWDKEVDAMILDFENNNKINASLVQPPSKLHQAITPPPPLSEPTRHLSEMPPPANRPKRVLSSYSAKDQDLSIEKSQPRNFIFGFGSIINTSSRINTGGATIGNAIPVELLPEEGYIREWNFQKDVVNGTFLGIKRVTKGEGDKINGVIYPCFETMEDFDKREEGYTRYKLNKSNMANLSWQNIPSHQCQIWVYVPDTTFEPTFNKPILQSYVDVCVNGCLEYGLKYLEQFIETTHGWSKYWINDRLLERRAWVHERNFKIIDKYVKKYLIKNKINVYSKLSVDYSNMNIKPECLIEN